MSLHLSFCPDSPKPGNIFLQTAGVEQHGSILRDHIKIVSFNIRCMKGLSLCSIPRNQLRFSKVLFRFDCSIFPSLCFRPNSFPGILGVIIVLDSPPQSRITRFVYFVLQFSSAEMESKPSIFTIVLFII